MRAVLKMIEQVVHAGVQKGELVAVQPAIFTYALAGMCHWIYRWYEPDSVWTPILWLTNLSESLSQVV